MSVTKGDKVDDNKYRKPNLREGFPVSQLRADALAEAYKRVWIDIYRSKMRYEPQENQTELGLTDYDVGVFDEHFKKETNSTKPLRYVVVGLPEEFGEGDYQSPETISLVKKLVDKCMKKCYVGKCFASYELGEGNHPHLNFVFFSSVKWLARSRIISEFSKTCQVDANYVDVTETGEYAFEKLVSYCSKEDIWSQDNYKNQKKHNFFSNRTVVGSHEVRKSHGNRNQKASISQEDNDW